MHISSDNRLRVFSIRVLFFGVSILFLLCLATLPLVFKSAISDLKTPPTDQIIDFTPSDIQPKDTYSRLHLHVTTLDEVNEQVKLKVHGFRNCESECDKYQESVLFFNADKKNDHLEEAIPVYRRVELPNDPREFTEEISIPMRGNLFFYPFDSYKISIGVMLERKFPDGRQIVLSPEETVGRLFITLEDDVPRASLSDLKVIDPKIVKPKHIPYEYAYARQMKFERPMYSIITVMLVLILSAAVTVFTMFTRAFDQLIINTSALIFGVWSIRSLLLTGYPSDITFLDTVLQAMVVFILMVLAFRSMNYFHRLGYMRLLPWARVPLTRQCPECLTNVKYHAKRCSACGSPIG